MPTKQHASPYTQVNVKITTKQKLKLKKYNVNLSALVRSLLNAYLKEMEKTAI